jgi:hypothetical protein
MKTGPISFQTICCWNAPLHWGAYSFSQDKDLLIEARRRQRADHPFGGIIYAHQLRVSIGQCIDALELIALTCSAEELTGRVTFIPL